ncbi:MAG TPA: type II secretion system F family protein [Bryobacteraceae bacterium]|nr:type II secretion system F family protein [Bryobacteraceae bacterium]
MFNDPQKVRLLLIAVPAFGLVLSLWIAVVLIWTRRRKDRAQVIENRIGLSGQAPGEGRVLRLWREGTEATMLVPAHEGITLAEKFQGLLEDAGWNVSIREIILGNILVSALVFLGALAVTRNLLPALCGPAAVVIIFWIYLNRRIARRSALFERQFADSLELAARSLRVGHPLVGALQLISEEFDAPVGPLFASICQQQALGRPLDDALRMAAGQHSSDDLKLFATAVIIQLRSGGSLADMMDRLAVVIRERIRLTRRVRVLTAQTQFSKRVLQGLPLFVFLLINFINPDYMRPLYSTDSGRQILIISVACLLIGSWLMNRLSVIRY